MFWWPQEYPLGPHLLQRLRTCKVVHLLLLDIRLVSNQLLLVYNISLYWEKSIGNKRYLCWRFRTLYHIEAPVFFIKEAYRASFKSYHLYIFIKDSGRLSHWGYCFFYSEAWGYHQSYCRYIILISMPL